MLTKIKTNSVLSVVLLFTLLFSCLFTLNVDSSQSGSTTATLGVIKNIVCIFNFVAKPEKRIPRTNNWNTLLTVKIYNSSNTPLTTVSQLRTANNGSGSIDLCPRNLDLSLGLYNFDVIGFSHLCKRFNSIPAFETDTQVVDFSTNGAELLAGETSNVRDEKINSLDMSTQIRYLYRTDDEKNDLNRDNKVNSLDFSNTIYNLYKLGQC
jgi:hypothetical protein